MSAKDGGTGSCLILSSKAREETADGNLTFDRDETSGTGAEQRRGGEGTVVGDSRLKLGDST